MATGLAIIQHAVQKGAGVPRDPIQTDLYDYAFDCLNDWGQRIWDMHPWLNTKTAVVSVTADSAGLITFGATVDVVRAIRETTNVTNTNYPEALFAEDEVFAASQGTAVSSDKYQPREDSALGYRQIQISAENDPTVRTLEAIVTLRFVPWTTSTISTDEYAIDVAEQALKEYLIDEIREYCGRRKLGEGDGLIQIALNKELSITHREHRVAPRHPMFSESGGEFY